MVVWTHLQNNYDPNATDPQNNCTYEGGCTSPSAGNYDETAIVDDGTCVFPDQPGIEIIYGCMG